MIETTAINLANVEVMMVTWDMGRRCNYDCSYCEVSRHDNVSPHHNLEELLHTFNFIHRWTLEYNNARLIPVDHININFTGGEPTMNPAFWELADTIKSNYSNFRLSLTTNGAWNSKYTDKIIDRFAGVTVSYHAEGHPNLKKQVIANILALKETSIKLQVNVMIHADHWEECLFVYEYLKSHGVDVKPRPIGDGNKDRVGWFIDADGSNRRTTHVYTAEQQEWFWNEVGQQKTALTSEAGTNIGRGCCGGRCIVGKINNEWKEVKMVANNFKSWHCTVDWFFLHIDQHTGLVYHHQTCQALHNGKTGALGNIENADALIKDLQTRLTAPTPIVCPNQRCGCGMCVPKAKSLDDFKTVTSTLANFNLR
jgi:MoaA/NifB/PqqE/SkfB family radical SAM enzyme